MTTTLNDLAAMKAKYMESIKNEGKALLAATFAEFFEANPDIKLVTWTQYTPYFNDGSPCTFGVHDFNVGTKSLSKEEIENLDGYINEEDDDRGLLSAWGYDYYAKQGRYPFVQAEFDALKARESATRELQRALEPHADLLEQAFGDGVRVAATRRGFTVVEISHD